MRAGVMPSTCCVGGYHVAEVKRALAKFNLRAGSLPEHRGLVVGFLDLDSDWDLGGLLVQTIVAGDCLKNKVVMFLQIVNCGMLP